MKSKLAGYIYGSALGDALGREVEFMNYLKIIEKYGNQGIQDLPDKADWTDDTQMMLAIADGLLVDHTADLEEIMSNITTSYIDWLDNPGFAPGNTCLKGANNLKGGIHWKKSGVAGSKGCGSVMRSGIIGIFYKDDLLKLKEVSSASGIATHGHPAADAACIAGSLAIKLALDGVHPRDMIDPILQETNGISDEFTKIMNKAYELVDTKFSDADALSLLGEGWVGEQAFAMAYFTVVRHADDYKSVVRSAANITGDSDSVACIAGGISGTILGISAIPEEWQDRLTNRKRLDSYIERITGKLSL